MTAQGMSAFGQDAPSRLEAKPVSPVAESDAHNLQRQAPNTTPIQQVDTAIVKELVDALEGMMRVFVPFPREDTEGWREEHEAYETARAAIAKANS